MSDELNNKGKPDRDRINVDEEHELRYWTRELIVSEERLRELVAKHGPMAKEIRSQFDS